MIRLKPYVRMVVNRVYHLLGIVMGARRELVGVRYFREHLKHSETLFILAPGASTSRYSPDDFAHIAAHDSIGINSFIVHEFKTDYALLEGKPTLGMVDFMIDRPDRAKDIQVLYKGYSSPTRWKIGVTIANLRKFRATQCKPILMLKDGYASDLGTVATLAIVLRDVADDRIYNYLGSVLYCLGLAYKAGYKNVVLCGVDFSSDYFYDAGSAAPIDPQEFAFVGDKNLISKNNAVHSQVLAEIDGIAALFTEAHHGTVYQFGCDGPLALGLLAYSRA